MWSNEMKMKNPNSFCPSDDWWKLKFPFLQLQSTLDITDFSVTQQKSAKSRFSAIRNYSWGQRSNIPQITEKLKEESCATQEILLRVIGYEPSWHQFLMDFSKFLSLTTKMKNIFCKNSGKNAIFTLKIEKITNKSLKVWLRYS